MNIETYLDLIFPNGLDFHEAFNLILNVGVYILGIGMYAIFIFHFYRFLSSRDMFRFDLSRYEESRYKVVRGILHFIMYVAKYIIVFPFFAFSGWVRSLSFWRSYRRTGRSQTFFLFPWRRSAPFVLRPTTMRTWPVICRRSCPLRSLASS